MVASDATALPKRTQHITYLDDDEFAVITPDSLSVYDLGHDLVKHKKEPYVPSEADSSKGEYEHFMMKEIMEQPTSVRNTLRGRLDDDKNTPVLGWLDLTTTDAKRFERIVALGCGTAYRSAVFASYLLEEITDVPMDVEVASEIVYRSERYDPKDTLMLAVSQSGETADTIAALNKYAELGYQSYGVVNVVGSTIARLTDGGTYLHCGPEVAVASTKAFTSQVVAQLLVGLKLNSLRGQPIKNNEAIIQALERLPADLDKTLQQVPKDAERFANKLKDYQKVMFLGRGPLYPIADEGSLKYKEITYTPAEAHPAGEMKHGPLALVDEDMLVVYLAVEGELFDKSLSNLKEIDARGGTTLVITDSKKLADDRVNAILVPQSTVVGTPLSINVVLQLFAYHVAQARGLEIDKPRNLAKSVTVE